MRWRVIVATLIVGLAAITLFVAGKRAAKKEAAPTPPSMMVVDATSADCETLAREACAHDGGCCGRVLLVQMLPVSKGGVPGVKLNADDLTWNRTEGILSDVLRTRADRTVFLTGDFVVTPAYKSQMIDMVRRAGTERVCVIDSRNPPKWYPPRNPPGRCGAGGGLQPAARLSLADSDLIVAAATK